MRDDELITIFFGGADVKVSLNAAGKTLKTELQLSTIKDEPLRFLPSDAVAILQAMPTELDAMLVGFGSLVALADKAIARKKEEVEDWAVYSADIGTSMFAILSFIDPFLPPSPLLSCSHRDISPVLCDGIHYIVLIGACFGPL